MIEVTKKYYKCEKCGLLLTSNEAAEVHENQHMVPTEIVKGFEYENDLAYPQVIEVLMNTGRIVSYALDTENIYIEELEEDI
jgi:hypothetical protein